MSSDKFVISEKEDSQLKSLGVLVRFIYMLPLLRYLFIPFAIALVIGSLAPQFFLWLVGEQSKCTEILSCKTVIPNLNIEVHLTFLIFLTVAAIGTFVRIIGWMVFEIGGQWAALSLHAKLVNSVSNVSTTFFDKNPSGRLINRLVKDFENLRFTGIIRISDVISALIEVFCGTLLISFVNPYAGLLILPVVLAIFYIQLNVASMLHKCATMRSSAFSDVLHRETDLIEGARAFLLYRKESALFSRLQFAVRKYIQMHLTHVRIESWGLFWSGIVNNCYALISLVVIVYAVKTNLITSVLAAVMVTIVLRLSGSFVWLAWVSAFLMDSVAIARRVFEYVDLPPETSEEFSEKLKSTQNKLHNSKLEGDIEFINYSMSYRAESPLILNNLNVKFPYAKKIGIIGRTGAGKSSLVQSLYRMVYVHNGDIRIGGKSIFEMDINFVRSHFSVVPQDPYLFEGTLRSNIDRTGKYSDLEMEKSLSAVGLSYSLDHIVHEGGNNFSLGERQLICLARVILTKRKYIIMDEPTSGVDTITDQKIQEVLSKHLTDVTVITIAHRVETLINYDLVIEMKEGKLLRQGSPEEMITKEL